MMFGGGMLLGWLLPVILLVLGGIWLFNNGSWANRSRDNDLFPRSAERTPEEILRQRYARGEITQTEYREMAETLRR